MLGFHRKPRIETARMTLRLPAQPDFGAWAHLRDISTNHLTQWEPVRAADHLSRRAFTNRVKTRLTKSNQWITMTPAGCYGASLHYLKAVQAMGAGAAKASGAAAVAQMKKMPTDDDAFGPGRIREDGRTLHPVYLFQTKTRAESTGGWDLVKIIATTPAEQGFKPMSEGGCALIKA